MDGVQLAASLKPPKPQAAPGPEPGPRPVSFAMRSHRGRARRVNQDACGALAEHGAFVVCDGVGGAAAGEVASRLAVDAFLQTFLNTSSAGAGKATEIPGARHAPDRSSTYTHGRLKAAVKAANDAVFRSSRRAPHLSGMGTTLVAALWDAAGSGVLWLANVGDSRCYRLRGNAFDQLTEDHSLVQEQVRAGTLSSNQAAASPMRNVITRAVGSLVSVEADIASHAVEAEDIYLLASDGLTRELEDVEIAAILRRTIAGTSDAMLQAACHALIDAANARGGHDNITVLLVARG